MNEVMSKYLRRGNRTIFCPGCGDGLILQHFVTALDDLKESGMLDLKRVVLVGGIGCSGWMPTYLNFDVLHVTHGRAISVATGIKLANPDLQVVVFTGDGDNLSIGGNHFIHAARRNVDIKVIMVNNMLYGMTGGQVSPETPFEAITHTTPYGNPEPPFDSCELAKAAGATYVTRWTTAHPKQIVNSCKELLLHRGFAYMEVVSQCPVYFGRYVVGIERPSMILDYFKKNSVLIKDSSVSGKVKNEKIAVGKFVDVKRKVFDPSFSTNRMKDKKVKGEVT